jgi:protein-tyrosine phosphatase
MHVSFVCTGNICRSPMAAIIFREHLRREGLADKVEVSSAGLGDWHVGNSADDRTVSILEEYGYSCDHVAAQVEDRHLQADLILAMDSGNDRTLRRLLSRAGGDPSRVQMLRSFDPEASAAGDLDVPDPYYGGRDGFPRVFRMIESTMPGLLAWVKERIDQ